jgi:dTDP-4-amino-4,6-dideoxygalactose transaminase
MRVPHSFNPVGREEEEAVLAVLRSGWVNDGPEGDRLVEDLLGATGAVGGTVASTGTHALVLALRACGVQGEQDEVILPDYACRVLYDAVRMAGGTPVVADVEEEGLSIDLGSVKGQVSDQTRAVVVPHAFGLPADIDIFRALGVPTIEDCAHAVGVRFRGWSVGGSGDFSVFSFEGTKLLPAGEGGAVLARTDAGVERLQALKWDDPQGAQACRLADTVSALARARLRGLPAALARRRELALRYREALSDLEHRGSLRLPVEQEGREHAWYRFVIRVENPGRLEEQAARHGVRISRPIMPDPLSSYLPVRGEPGRVAAVIHASAASLPIYPSLTLEQLEYTASVVREALS